MASNSVHMETINLAGTLEVGQIRSLVDVYPFHIIGGHLTVSGVGVQVLAVQITNNQIQHAVSLEFTPAPITGNAQGQVLFLADLAQTITGDNPFTGNLPDTVSNITHLLLYNGNTGGGVVELNNIVVAMSIIYSP